MVRSCYRAALFVFAAFVLVCPALASDSVSVVSPNGAVAVSVTVGPDARYSLTYGGTAVLKSSKLGLTFRGAEPFGALKLIGSSTREIDETWRLTCGRKSVYADRCVETALDLQEENAPGRKLRVIVRAYDGGAALRYAIPEDAGVFDAQNEFCVESEETEFAFEKDYDVWAAFFNGFASNHEGNFQKKKLSDIKPDSFVGIPLVVLGDGFAAALTQSDLLDWSGVQFRASDAPLTLRTLLAPRDDKRGCVVRRGPALSPWRVVILGKTPIDLVNNADVVLNTASPCEIDDSWIKPGNSAWDWWAPKGGREISTRAIREFIDFAADMKWDYALVDAGWYLRDGKNVKIGPDGLVVRDGFDVPELVEYGRAKGVGLLLWIDWPDLVQVDPRKTLKRCSDWGVAGVKIDHMNSHSQETVASLTETVRAAAEYKLLVNFHGMYEPTGLERTLPNQITREGIYGNEYFRGRAISQTLVAALPYTRCLIGPGDYTPGGFRNTHLETYRPLKEQTGANASTEVVGTRAHELALCMLLDSPLRCLCDLPRVYKDQPGLEYLRALPATWDDTVALDGAIGEFYVAARRSGEDWYLSGITNEQSRAFAVTLDFLDDGASYDATFYADAPESDADAAAIDITSKTVVKGDVLNFTAVRDGGWNAVLKRKR